MTTSRWAGSLIAALGLALLGGCASSQAVPPRPDVGTSGGDLLPSHEAGCGGWIGCDGAGAHDGGNTGDSGSKADGGQKNDSAQESDSGAQVPAQIVLVALNTARNGALGGLAAANALCQAQAQAAGAAGSYRAFLSTATRNVRDLIPPAAAQRPVVNNRGQALFASWAQIFSGLSKWPGAGTIYTFGGVEVDNGTGAWVDGNVWHGSKPDGTVYGGHTCLDWTSGANGDRGENGEVDQHELLRQETHDCNTLQAVACVKVTE